MTDHNSPRRNPGIMAGFDKAALRRHVEDADRKRALTQDELAAAYGADGDIVAYTRAFPASLDDIVAGIAAQDQRFLDQGRKLLKAALRKQAAAAPAPAKKARGRGMRRADAALPPEPPADDTALPAPAADMATNPRPADLSTAPLFEAGDADLYGG